MVDSLQFTYSDALLVSAATLTNSVKIWDVQDGTLLYAFRTPLIKGAIASSRYPHVIIPSDSQPALWDDSSNHVGALSQPFRCAAFMPSGRNFITSSQNQANKLLIWKPLPLPKQEKPLDSVWPTGVDGQYRVADSLTGPQVRAASK